MSLQSIVERIVGYRASLWATGPTEEDMRRELAEASAAASFAKGGVAPLPESIISLARILNDPNYRTREAVAALESDPALAIELLRLANSPAFRGATACQTTVDAFNRLGAKRIKDLIVVAHFESLGAAMAGYSRIAFDHSVRVAQISRTLPATRTCTSERLYLCGLVHDIGTTLLDESGEFTYYVGHYQDDQEQCDAERAALGFDHAILGAVAAELWELPAPISETVLAHHLTANEFVGEVGHMSACLALAEHLEEASRESESLSSELFEELALTPAGAHLDLGADALAALWNDNVVGQIRKVQQAKTAA